MVFADRTIKIIIADEEKRNILLPPQEREVLYRSGGGKSKGRRKAFSMSRFGAGGIINI
jgi:hypothetical protein